MTTPRAVLLAILALLLYAPDAHAQATRTWVSGVGDDANPCSRTAPCKTFAGTISKTAAGGEINVPDPNGAGAVTITKSISIIAEGNTSGILASLTNGIIINAAATDFVHLEGLDIEGTGDGLNGIKILQAANVTIRKCNIRNFKAVGSNGILVATAGGTKVSITESILTNNDFAISVAQTGAAAANVFVERVHLSRNRVGINAASLGTVRVSASSIVHNTNGVKFTGTGAVISFGNNVIDGNVQAEVPSSTVLLK